MEGSRVVISVLGRDRVGIIASITQILAQHQVNIIDITQTIIQDIFTMVMIADFASCPVDLRTVRDRLTDLGNALGVQITVQHEEVFQYMHRI